MNIGVTATRQTLAAAQLLALSDEMVRIGGSVLHHGDCVGGDEATHMFALEFGWNIKVHPPTNDRWRAWCGIYVGTERWAGQVTILEERAYIRRNHDIVDIVERLLVVPSGFHEITRSGTWATSRYAASRLVPRTFIYPDGTITREES